MKAVLRVSIGLFLTVFGIALVGCRQSSEPTEAEAYLDKVGTAALLITRNGEEIFSCGDTARKYPCHSIRKPFLGALYGIGVDEGLIDPDATLEELGIDDRPPVLTDAEKRATLRDLLASRSGVYHEAAGEAPSMVAARPDRGSRDPGEHFYYNNWDFNVLGTVYRELTGRCIFRAFEEEIAEPIGMQDFVYTDGVYSYEREKSRHPAYFFRMSTRDMARFGRLYGEYGRWEGRRIVPEDWIRESTTLEPLPGQSGDPYGYLWRIIPKEDPWGPGFYHTGSGVHALIVLPERNLVLVHRVDTEAPYDITWTEIRIGMELALAEAVGTGAP